ncbi:MAG: DUF3459 domain-containing protein, partial [Planctomycetota bacterium]|nr:DUF3459 domain-containing protein [Planctomycetota bacterium]
FQGTPQELISAVQRGYLYQGQWNGRRQIYRGSATWGIPAARFITFLQNHDQVANSLNGRRIQSYTSPGRLRALTTLMLLAPQTPLLFMGQEFCSSQPFLYFADHHEELSKVIRQGRAESLHQFQTARSPEMNLFFADPGSIETFEKCKLDWQQYETNHEVVDMHRDLLRLRKSDPVFSRQDATTIHGAVLAAEAFALRYHGPDGDDRLLIVNLGRDLYWNNLAEPLLAPRQGTDWSLLFSTGNPRYGGPGIGILDTQRWHVPGHAALVLQPVGVT